MTDANPTDGLGARVIIADAGWLAKHGLPAGTGPATAWFLGDDHELYQRLRDDLSGSIEWGPAGERMTDTAAMHEDAFINLDQGFHIDDTDWWECRNLSERGPYSTTFVTECCRLILFNETSAAGGCQLYVVEDADLANVLIASARARNLPLRRLGPWAGARVLTALKRTAADAARYFLATVQRWREIRRLAALRRIDPVPIDRLADCNVLIAAWTKAGDFSIDAPRSHAHSMGPLPAWLRAEGVRTGFIALPLTETSDAYEIARNVCQAADAVMHADDGLTAGNLFRTVAATLIGRAHPKAGFTIAGHDITDIARMVLAREQFSWRPTNAALWSHVGSFLARNGIRPKAVFHVYENQTWEKGLRHGLRRALPATRIVGCQQSPFSQLYPNMIPSRSELEPGRWPDCVLALGRNSERKLTKAAEPERIKLGGLMRQDAAYFTPPDKPQQASARRLLCAAGPGYKESLELASKVQVAVAAMPDVSFLVNFHPLTSHQFRENLRRFLADRANGTASAEFTDAPMRTLLDQGIQAVFYGDTNAGFDAISANARAVHVARDHNLSFDKLPDGLSRRVKTADDIRQAINDLQTPASWPPFDQVTTQMNECFSAPDIGVILAAGGLSGNTPEDRPIPTTEKVVEK